MIYFDNAATSYPKPYTVVNAVRKSFNYAANPGRAGHKLSLKAAESIFLCREKIADLINSSDVEKIILMPSCTMALNTVIKGVLQKGDHIVISSLEHNSVLRPIKRLYDEGLISYDVADVFEGDDDRTIDSFRKLIKNNTKLCVCTHASNVFGVKLPVSRLAALCHYYGVLFCLDAAQTIGVTNIDIDDIGADFLCAPGHKGLYGPMGTGFLVVNCKELPKQLTEGGTGSSSLLYSQPDVLPDKYESGTLNLSGINGLSAGIDFVKTRGIINIENREMNFIRYIYDEIKKTKNIELYTNRPTKNNYVPLLSFNIKDMDCNDVSFYLDQKYNIATRSGLHCSPLAHKTYNTENLGTVRICPSVFTDVNSVNTLLFAIKSLIK